MRIADHAGRADNNKALFDHGLELTNHARNSLGRIDDLDHDRNAERSILARDIVDLPMRAVSDLDREDRGTGHVPMACHFDDRAIKRLATPLLVGIAVDADETG